MNYGNHGKTEGRLLPSWWGGAVGSMPVWRLVLGVVGLAFAGCASNHGSSMLCEPDCLNCDESAYPAICLDGSPDDPPPLEEPCADLPACGVEEVRSASCACECAEGFRRFEGECVAQSDCSLSPCAREGEICVADLGVREGYLCVCPEGYGVTETSCVAPPACGVDACPGDQLCRDEAGVVSCYCPGEMMADAEGICGCSSGTRRDGVECLTCEDLAEGEPRACGSHSVCDEGTISCECEEGYVPAAGGACVRRSALMYLADGGLAWSRVTTFDPMGIAPEPASVAAMFAQPSEGALYFITVGHVHRLSVSSLRWTERRAIGEFFPGAVAPAYGVGVLSAHHAPGLPGAVSIRTAAWVESDRLTVVPTQRLYADFRSGAAAALVLNMNEHDCSAWTPWRCWPGSIPETMIGATQAAWFDDEPAAARVVRNIRPPVAQAECLEAYNRGVAVTGAVASLGRSVLDERTVFVRDSSPEQTCSGPVMNARYSDYAPFQVTGAPRAESVQGAAMFRSEASSPRRGFFVWAQ